MQFKVQNMRLCRTDSEPVVQGEAQTAYFSFDASWEGKVKTAGFVRDGDVVYRAAIVDGACPVPPGMVDVPSFGVVVFMGGLLKTNPVEIAVEPNPLALATILPPDDLYSALCDRLDALEKNKVGKENEVSAHRADSQNPHGVTKEQVGLGLADNTADTDKPVSRAVEAALVQKADRENFFVIGENITVEECYQRIPHVVEVNENEAMPDIEGVPLITRAMYASEIMHVTANAFINLVISYNGLTDGTEAAIHCENTHGMRATFMYATNIYNAFDEPVLSMHLQHGDILLFRCVGDKTYLICKKQIAFSDGTHTAVMPLIRKNRSLGDMIWRNADEFLPNTKLEYSDLVPGEYALEANGRYAWYLLGDVSFVLPSKVSINTDNRIEIILHCPYEYNVSFGDVLFANGKTPVFSAGCYKIICVYDVLYFKWCVAATEYREDWSQALGLMVDYDNCVFERLEAAVGKTKGADFDAYPMYGGRRRCNVEDSGTILACEGDTGYTEDGTNGQVMVYQPAFYYKLIPLVLDGTKLRKAEYYISEKPLAGFKRHPAFYDVNGNEIDYILLSAFEGCIYDADAGENGSGAYVLETTDTLPYAPNFANYETDKLSSIAGAFPSRGVTVAEAERLANNRGEGWHIDHMLSLSVNQWLMMIESGALNSRKQYGSGIVLGNPMKTGTKGKYNSNGDTQMLYRGCESLWGNVGMFVGGFRFDNDTNMYVAPQYFYDATNQTLPWMSMQTTYCGRGYISAFAYIADADWAFVFAEAKGTSALPVGSYTYGNPTEGMGIMVAGLSYGYTDRSGIFAYYPKSRDGGTSEPVGARLLYIPTAQQEDEA